jgi:hypothetical protein
MEAPIMTGWRMRSVPSVLLAAILVPCHSYADTPSVTKPPALHKPNAATIAALQEQIPELLKDGTVPGL